MGVMSDVVREKLLDQEKLTITTVDLCRSGEVTGQLLMGMSANEGISVYAVIGHRSTHINNRSHGDSKPRHVHRYQVKCCKYCGNAYEPRKCPACGRDCSKCGKKPLRQML